MRNMGKYFDNIYRMSPNEINSRFKYLGEGISRAAYAVNNKYVVKRATNLDGFDQCALENMICRNSGYRYGKYLCPVIWYRPGMVAMPRAVPMSQLSPHRKFSIKNLGWNVYDDLKHLSKQYNLLFKDIEDTSSWGVLGGRPVLIDYGCTN